LNKKYGEAETERLYDLQRKCLESIRVSAIAYLAGSQPEGNPKGDGQIISKAKEIKT
jgi:hypothetical protein